MKDRHAEYCALRKINDDVDNVDLSGCTVYTTLEPCSKRNSSNKTACATRLINAKAERVVYAMPDKDESVYGHVSLLEADPLVVPFVAAGIALATCRMHSHGIERVTQRFADFTAGHICRSSTLCNGAALPPLLACQSYSGVSLLPPIVALLLRREHALCLRRHVKDPVPLLPLHHGRASAQPHAKRLVSLRLADFPLNISESDLGK